jgi:hypothetical protein
MEKNEYKQALEQAKRNIPNDTAGVKQIERQANIYRRKQLKRLQTHLIKKEWEKAEQLLFSLRATQPDHQQFDKAQQQLNNLREQERLSVESHVALATARLLQTQSEQESFKRRNTQTKRYWWQSKTPLESKKQELVDTLLGLSIEAINQDNYKLAKTTFEQALTFNNDLKHEEIRNQIRNGLKQRNAATINQRQSRLIRQLNDAMNDENFEQILTLSSLLANPPFKGKAVNDILNDAKMLLTVNAQELEQQGDSIYRQGNISSAIELWQQAQALLPSLPGLHDKLVRAQKVKHKLDFLRQSQNQE